MHSLRESIPVVAALIEKNGRVLVAQRPPHKAQGRKWEFPGGKVEPNEPPPAALQREIREELGVDTIIGAPLPPCRHDYGSVHITLLPYRCRLADAQAEPVPHEHIALRWVTPEELRQLDLAPADWPVVEAWSAVHQRTETAPQ